MFHATFTKVLQLFTSYLYLIVFYARKFFLCRKLIQVYRIDRMETYLLS